MYTTEGIVLKRTDVGEADSLFTLYTRDFGKMRALAQGVKKEGAKLKGHLEPFGMASVSFVIGRSGARLTHASLLNFWEEMCLSFSKLRAARYMADLVDAHCGEGERDSALWEFFSEKLQILAEMDNDRVEECIAQFCKMFQRDLLVHLGYGDDDEKMREGEIARWRDVRYNEMYE